MTQKSAWYLYIIENKLGQFYTGITTDVLRRFNEHQQGSKKAAKALRGKNPLTMLFCIQLGSHSEALKAELWVKKQSKLTKKQLISGQKLPPFQFTHMSLDILRNQSNEN